MPLGVTGAKSHPSSHKAIGIDNCKGQLSGKVWFKREIRCGSSERCGVVQA